MKNLMNIVPQPGRPTTVGTGRGTQTTFIVRNHIVE